MPKKLAMFPRLAGTMVFPEKPTTSGSEPIKNKDKKGSSTVNLVRKT
jgi:hypothetical protein